MNNKESTSILTKINFSKFALRLIEYINLARKNPNEIIDILKQSEIKTDKNNESFLILNDILPFTSTSKDKNNNKLKILITEGEPLIKELISFLHDVNESGYNRKLHVLHNNKNITYAAEDLLNLLTIHDNVNMKDLENKKNSDLFTRINHYGESYGELIELIDNGSFDPFCVVMNFFIM